MSPLFALLRDVARREGGALAEEEVLHLAGDELLRFFLPGHETILVEDHFHAILPQLPRLRRDVVVNALSDLAGPRWGVEAGHLLLEFHALDRPTALVADGRLVAGTGCALAHAADRTTGGRFRLESRRRASTSVCDAP